MADPPRQPVGSTEWPPVHHHRAADTGAEDDAQEAVHPAPSSEDGLGERRGPGILDQRRRERYALLQAAGEGSVTPEQVGAAAGDAHPLVDEARPPPPPPRGGRG